MYWTKTTSDCHTKSIELALRARSTIKVAKCWEETLSRQPQGISEDQTLDILWEAVHTGALSWSHEKKNDLWIRLARHKTVASRLLNTELRRDRVGGWWADFFDRPPLQAFNAWANMSCGIQVEVENGEPRITHTPCGSLLVAHLNLRWPELNDALSVKKICTNYDIRGWKHHEPAIAMRPHLLAILGRALENTRDTDIKVGALLNVWWNNDGYIDEHFVGSLSNRSLGNLLSMLPSGTPIDASARRELLSRVVAAPTETTHRARPAL